MTMWIEIVCDECNGFLEGYHYDRKALAMLREVAKKAGWKKTERPNGYLCPECQAKLRELNTHERE